MSAGKYILFDGTFVPTETFRLGPDDLQGVHVSEQFRAVRTSFPFFAETLEMLRLKLVIFNCEFPEFTGRDGAGLLRQMSRTLTKNKLFMGARLTLTIWFSNGKPHYSIVPEKLESADYELNERGLFVGIFDKIQKPVSSLSTLTLGSELFWQIARSQEPEGIDEMLIVNHDDRIVEAPGSNIYLIRKNQVMGASEKQGAYIDVSRPLMLRIFRQLKLEFTDDEGINAEDLENAGEVMLVSAIKGIRWVAGFSGKRYFNNTVKKIQTLFVPPSAQ